MAMNAAIFIELNNHGGSIPRDRMDRTARRKRKLTSNDAREPYNGCREKRRNNAAGNTNGRQDDQQQANNASESRQDGTGTPIGNEQK